MAGAGEATAVTWATPGRGRARLARRSLRLALLLAPATLVLGVLFVYPLASMGSLSVRTVFPGAWQLTGEHYAKFVADPYFQRVTLTTFELAADRDAPDHRHRLSGRLLLRALAVAPQALDLPRRDLARSS